jgi:hypothetical protein
MDSKNNNTAISTKIASRLSDSARVGRETHRKTLNKSIPIWIFFISFLVSVGFLWLEPKLLLRNPK